MAEELEEASKHQQNTPVRPAHTSSHLNYLAWVAGEPCSIPEQMEGEREGGRKPLLSTSYKDPS